MGKYLMARIIEGTDTWYDYSFKDNMRKYSFLNVKKINNELLAIAAPCDQNGFDKLYNIGKTLWDNGMCLKFEIAAFDGDSLFWKTRPDKWNFEQGRYNGWFDSMIAEELKSFHSEDFQNDPLETEYLLNYQNQFWDNKTQNLSPGAFEQLMDDTKLYEAIATVRRWIDKMEAEDLFSDLSDMSFIPHHCGFVYKGQHILNPFYDQTLRSEVEPVSYYGKENMKKYVSNLQRHIEALSPQHSPLDEKITAAERKKENQSISTIEKNPSIENKEL